MPNHLYNDFLRAGLSAADASTLQALAYASPLEFIVEYPPGTPEREAVGSAYREVQRYLTITGICISSVIVLVALTLRNPRLGDEQSLPEAEKLEKLRSKMSGANNEGTEETKQKN